MTFHEQDTLHNTKEVNLRGIFIWLARKIDSRKENNATRPSRGSFDLKAAMEESRAQGYGKLIILWKTWYYENDVWLIEFSGSVTGARLRFAGTPLGDVAPIYLCKNRSGNHCCDNKDPDCFTPGGCFCDSSCRAFGKSHFRWNCVQPKLGGNEDQESRTFVARNHYAKNTLGYQVLNSRINASGSY